MPKARILKRTEGLVKMATHPESRQIMGVHLLAPHAGELVAQAVTLIRNRNTIDDVLASLPHLSNAPLIRSHLRKTDNQQAGSPTNVAAR